MFPILFQYKSFTLHTYGVFVALGFLLAYGLALKLAARENLPAGVVSDGAWTALLGGLVGARLLYVAFEWPYYSQTPAEIFKIWQGGLIWYGGLLGGLAAFTIWLRAKKEPFLKWADILAPALALGHGFGRLGCFFAGCCFGRTCHLPWAVKFRHPETLAPQNLPLHPSQIYESALTFGLAGLLYALSARPAFRAGNGKLFAIYLAGYGLARFAVEFTRGDDRGPVLLGLTATQWISLALILAGAWTGAKKAEPAAHAG